MWGYRGWFLLIPAVILVWLSLQGRSEQLPAVQFSPPATQTATTEETQPALELPCVVRGSGLIIEKTVSYEGDFWEDGSNMPAVDVMGLVVYNPGASGIRRAEILVQQGSRQLSFVIAYLPPGSRVLVLERFRNAYSREPLTGCGCASPDIMEWENAAEARVEPAGVCELAVTNQTDAELSSVTLRYKRYDPESEMYLGGIAYQLTVEPLAAGESLQVSPLQYVEGRSRVVLVEAETCGT